MRDTHPKADKEYWEGLLEFQNSCLIRLKSLYPHPGSGEATKRMPASSYQNELFCHALALYSFGTPLGEVVDMARASVIDTLPKYLADFPPNIKKGTHTGYDNVHRWLATVVLCRATPSEVSEFYEGIDLYGVNPSLSDKPDRIWTIYRNYLLDEDTPLPPTVHWPEAYAPLARAMDPELPDAARPMYLREFLDGWYKEMSSEVAAQTTWGDNLGPESEYVGYWCLEAAGAAVLLGIDDTNLADHPYYPKDWADWARGRG